MGRTRIPAEDLHKRICFLYQAAHACLKSSPKDATLSRYYVNSLQIIARKNLISLHPDMKRTLCKRCCCLLVSGVTSIVRVKKKRQEMTTVTCLECGTWKRYPSSGSNIPIVDRPECWDDIITNGITIAPVKHEHGQKKQKQGKQKQKPATVPESAVAQVANHSKCESIIEKLPKDPAFVGTKSKCEAVMDTQSKCEAVMDTQSKCEAVMNTQSNCEAVMDTQSKCEAIMDTQSKCEAVMDTQSKCEAVMDTQSKFDVNTDTHSKCEAVTSASVT